MVRGLVGILVSAVVMTAPSSRAQSVIDRSRESFPTYDPGFAQRQAEEAKVPAHHANRPRLRSIPPPRPKSISPETPAVAEAEIDPEVVALPEMSVETQALPIAPIPRLAIDPAKKDVILEPFMSPEAEAELMVEKHLGIFDRLFFNRFDIFGSNKERAGEAENREKFAHAMNSIAEGIEQADLWGLTPDEIKKLQQEYLELLNARPQ